MIPGDGIGKEVVPEGLRVLDAAASKFNIQFEWEHFDWSCDYYLRNGSMMPADWKEQVGKHDAIFFGAVGWPAKVPDHISLWGSLIKFRREFDQYVNLRPSTLYPGVPGPLKEKNSIDLVVYRENTEGEYAPIGGRLYVGTPNETAVQTSVFTRRGCERVMRAAFEGARKRRRMQNKLYRESQYEL